MRIPTPLLAGLVLILLSACASTDGDSRKLEQVLYAYQSAIRWNDIPGAIAFVDPKLREELALKDLEARRLEQYQVTGYYVQSSQQEEHEVKQIVEIRLVNRHTQVERSVIDRQTWRWSKEDKAWWLTTPLPKLGAGS